MSDMFQPAPEIKGLNEEGVTEDPFNSEVVENKSFTTRDVVTPTGFFEEEEDEVIDKDHPCLAVIDNMPGLLLIICQGLPNLCPGNIGRMNQIIESPSVK